MEIKCTNKFYIRIARLPINVFFSVFCSDNKNTIKKYYQKNFKTDIFLSSQTLYNSLQTNENNDKKAFYSLLKYLIRSSTRTTPYASLSSMSVGFFDEISKCEISDRYVYPNFDFEWLNKIIHIVENELNIDFYVIKNNTLLETKHKIYNLWVSCYCKENNFSNTHKSIDNTKAVKIVLHNTQTYIKKSDLYMILKEQYPQLSTETYTAFILELLKNEILISNIRNCFFENNPLKEIMHIISENHIASDNELFMKLSKINLDKKFLIPLSETEKIINYSNDFQSILPNDKILKWDSKLNGIFTLEKNIKNEIEDYLSFLYDFSDQNYSFKASIIKFKDLFNDSFIPLNVAWSVSEGIGIPQKDNFQRETNKLLDIIASNYFDKEILMDNFTKKQRTNRFLNYENGGEISFHIVNNNGKKLFVTSPLLGSNIKNESIGRFKYLFNDQFDNSINDSFKNIIVNYIPKKSRIGNVFGNLDNDDILLEYGIFSNNQKKKVKLSDILIGVYQNKFVFKEKNTNTLLSFITNDKVNLDFMPSHLRFLVDASKELLPDLFQIHREIWKHANESKVFPRCRYKDFIISPKTWNLRLLCDQEKNLNFLSFSNHLNTIKNNYQVPDIVYLETGDQRILINLNIKNHIEIVYDIYQKEKNIKLFENFISDNLIIEDNIGNSYLGEFIFQFDYSNFNSIDMSKIQQQVICNEKRFFNPFDKYVTVRINVSKEFETDVLLQLFPEINKLKYITKQILYFYFVRYKDEKSDHLRLRFKICDKSSSSILSIVKLLIDTKYLNYDLSYEFLPYNRELERYGNSKIVFFEQLFDINSQIVMKILENSLNKLWKWNLEEYFIIFSILFLKDIGFDMQKEGYLVNFKLSKQELKKFSQTKNKIISLFSMSEYGFNLINSIEGMKLYTLYDKYSLPITRIWSSIISDTSPEEINYFISSYLHMFHNRLLGTSKSKETKLLGLIESVLYSLEQISKHKDKGDSHHERVSKL